MIAVQLRVNAEKSGRDNIIFPAEIIKRDPKKMAPVAHFFLSRSKISYMNFQKKWQKCQRGNFECKDVENGKKLGEIIFFSWRNNQKIFFSFFTACSAVFCFQTIWILKNIRNHWLTPSFALVTPQQWLRNMWMVPNYNPDSYTSFDFCSRRKVLSNKNYMG